MKIIYLPVVYILLSILLIPFLLSLLIKEIPNDIQPSLEGTQMLTKDTILLQQFTSKMDNLSGIGTSIKNPYFRNKKDLILILYDEDKNLLKRITLNGANVADGDFIIIRFDPIIRSKDKKYSFELLAPDVENKEALEIFLSSQKPSWIGDLYINSQKNESKIPFITYHRPANLLSISSQIFIQWGKRLFADLPFAVLYVLLLVGLIGYLFYTKRSD